MRAAARLTTWLAGLRHAPSRCSPSTPAYICTTAAGQDGKKSKKRLESPSGAPRWPPPRHACAAAAAGRNLRSDASINPSGGSAASAGARCRAGRPPGLGVARLRAGFAAGRLAALGGRAQGGGLAAGEQLAALGTMLRPCMNRSRFAECSTGALWRETS